MDDLYADLPPEANASGSTTQQSPAESHQEDEIQVQVQVQAQQADTNISSNSSSNTNALWAQKRHAIMLAARKKAEAASAPSATLPRPSRTRVVANAADEQAPAATEPHSQVMGYKEEEVDDPYDPSYPNDYVEVLRLRKANKERKRRDERIKAAMLEKEKQEAEHLENVRQSIIGGQGSAVSLSSVPSGGRGRGRGAANLPAWLTAQQSQQNVGGLSGPANSSITPGDRTQPEVTGRSLVAKVIAKMGLEAPVGVKHHPTCVIQLRNMVAPGEVDDDLEQETMEECSNFGPVVKCVALDVPPGAPSGQVVRAFVEFENVACAQRAKEAMDGRFFGGRQVSASYFDEERFRKGEFQ
jgi:hypothetical protein